MNLTHAHMRHSSLSSRFTIGHLLSYVQVPSLYKYVGMLRLPAVNAQCSLLLVSDNRWVSVQSSIRSAGAQQRVPAIAWQADGTVRSVRGVMQTHSGSSCGQRAFQGVTRQPAFEMLQYSSCGSSLPAHILPQPTVCMRLLEAIVCRSHCMACMFAFAGSATTTTAETQCPCRPSFSGMTVCTRVPSEPPVYKHDAVCRIPSVNARRSSPRVLRATCGCQCAAADVQQMPSGVCLECLDTQMKQTVA